MIGKKHIYLQCQYKFSINSILITVKKPNKIYKIGWQDSAAFSKLWDIKPEAVVLT